MEPLAFPSGDAAELDLERVEAAFAAAVAAAASADTPAGAVDEALGALHDGLGSAGVSAFVLEHGRLWSIAVRGYAMIPDGLPLDEGVIGRAVRTSDVQFARD